ncbi:hypothetical protein [Kitasatospora sp. NPDC098663]|uniref:hypothetical protein n=1 Tax=Kitasatospora sp. NPDC098663 TaxID=3364096 RepID=UPI0038025296
MGLGDEQPDLRDRGLDTLKALAALGRIDVDVERRQLLRTLTYSLGTLSALVKARQHSIEEACTIWSRSLDAMQTVRSARTRDVALGIRSALSPYRGRKVQAIDAVDGLAAEYLAATI